MTDDEKEPNLLEQERNALDLIARTPEGLLLHRHLRRVLEAVYDGPDTWTLQGQTGRRTLARDLMRLMAAGIEATSDGRGADKSILSGRRKPIDASPRRRGTERRVELERGDGWLPDSSYDAAGKLKPT